MFNAADGNLCFAVQNLHKSIKRRRMFLQFFAFVKGKKRYIACRIFDNRPVYNGLGEHSLLSFYTGREQKNRP